MKYAFSPLIRLVGLEYEFLGPLLLKGEIFLSLLWQRVLSLRLWFEKCVMEGELEKMWASFSLTD